MISPCKDCVEREIGCHSICPKYNTFKFFNNWKNDIKRKSLLYEASGNAPKYYSNSSSQHGRIIPKKNIA